MSVNYILYYIQGASKNIGINKLRAKPKLIERFFKAKYTLSEHLVEPHKDENIRFNWSLDAQSIMYENGKVNLMLFAGCLDGS